MSDTNTFYEIWTPRLLSVMRIIVAFLFIFHGAQKLFGYPPASPPMQGPMPPLMLAAGILEVFGALLILCGLFTRPVAFILSGQMAIAYFMVHQPQTFLPFQNGGELAVLYSFVFLFFSVAGSGEWSLDRLFWEPVKNS